MGIQRYTAKELRVIRKLVADGDPSYFQGGGAANDILTLIEDLVATRRALARLRSFRKKRYP